MRSRDARRERRCRRQRTRTTQRAPTAFVDRPGDDQREPEHGVVGAHQERERAAAQPVGRAPLDERDVRDDGDAVPEPATIIAAAPTQTFGATAAPAIPNGEDDEQRAVGRRDRAASISAPAASPPSDEPDAGPAQSSPKPKSPAS